MNKNNRPGEEERKHFNHSVLLAFGSNLGNKKSNIEKALILLAADSSVQITHQSSFYETAPWGKTKQPSFINSAAVLETSLEPDALLDLIKHIEIIGGRQKRERWFEREIDIDILLYDELIYKTGDLTIPHPEMHKRNFVLVPAAEIAASFYHPVLKKSISELLDKSRDTLEVKKSSV